MNPATLALIAMGLDALLKLWAQHTNKPADWKPTPQDWLDLMAQIDAATPEAEKAAASARLTGSN